MVRQHAAKLAMEIISSYFGDLVTKVCRCLLQRGTLSLQEIIPFTDMTGSHVKNCLFVLIQDNCVQAFSTPRKGSTDKTVTQYMVIFDNIINRVLFSKFLSIVKGDLGPEAEAFFEGLLQNGRLTFEQMVERSISKEQHMDQAMRKNHQSELRVCFNNLVRWHYVEQCPRPEPFIDPDSEDQPKLTKRRGAKTVEQPPSLEQQAFEAATLTTSERFSEIPESPLESAEDGTGNHSSATGHKRKHETLQSDPDPVVSVAKKFWRANFEKLLYCLKTKICAENVRSRLGVDGGVVFEAIMEANTEQKMKGARASATLDRILDRLRDKPAGISMTLDHVRKILDELHCKQSTEKLEKIQSQGSRDTANIFLWKLDRKAFSKTVLDYIFHAALNLTDKISQLVEKQHEILEDDMKKLIQKKTIATITPKA